LRSDIPSIHKHSLAHDLRKFLVNRYPIKIPFRKQNQCISVSCSYILVGMNLKPLFTRVNLERDIHAHDIMTGFCQACSADQPYIATADYRDFHLYKFHFSRYVEQGWVFQLLTAGMGISE